MGLLHKNGVERPRPWPATEFRPRRIDAITEHIQPIVSVRRSESDSSCGSPRRTHARGESIDEHKYPHCRARREEGVAQQRFSTLELESSLDALLAELRRRRWPVRWRIWNLVIDYERGGRRAIEARTVLRAHDRL